LRARAIENQIFVIGCNRCGSGGGDRYGGHSIAVAPDGSVLGECNENDDIVMTLEIDPSLISQIRKRFPFSGGRNPGLYSPVTSLH
jgi:predicted amidohydrolase